MIMRPGPQPPKCCLQDCTNPPAAADDVYCAGHKAHYAKQNGTAITPPVIEPDDPHLLEREARKAAAQEEVEYAERRRVKTWRTLENGSRVPDTYWTDAELAAIEAQAAEALTTNLRVVGTQLPVSQDMLADAAYMALTPPPQDPEKAALKLLKQALRGKLGDAAGRAAWGLVEMLREDR